MFAYIADIGMVYIILPFVRKDVDNLDRILPITCRSFPTVANKTSPKLHHLAPNNRDIRVRYKQCTTRKLCTLALMLKGFTICRDILSTLARAFGKRFWPAQS